MFARLTVKSSSAEASYACFRQFDQGAKGEITVEDIKDTYSRNEIDIDDDVAHELFYQYDWDHDGRISPADFNSYLNDANNFTHVKCSKYNAASAWPRHATKHMLGLASYEIPFYEENNKIMSHSAFDDDDMLEQIRVKIAQKITGGGMEQYRAFKLFDVRNEGFVKEDALKFTLENFGFSIQASDLMNLFQYFDADGDGVISQKDFTSRVLRQDFGKAMNAEEAKKEKRALTETEGLIRVVNVEQAHSKHTENRNVESRACRWLSTAGAVEPVQHGSIHSSRKEGTMTTRGYQYMEAGPRHSSVKHAQKRTLLGLREGL